MDTTKLPEILSNVIGKVPFPLGVDIRLHIQTRLILNLNLESENVTSAHRRNLLFFILFCLSYTILEKFCRGGGGEEGGELVFSHRPGFLRKLQKRS